MTQPVPVEFDLALEEIPVTLKRPDKTPWDCILKEMDGYKRDMYLNSQRSKIGSAGSTNLKDFADVQTALIAQCLYEKSTGEAVPAVSIREFPSKVQMKLYTMCMELNGFNDKAEDDAKNS